MIIVNKIALSEKLIAICIKGYYLNNLHILAQNCTVYFIGALKLEAQFVKAWEPLILRSKQLFRDGQLVPLDDDFSHAHSFQAPGSCAWKDLLEAAATEM